MSSIKKTILGFALFCAAFNGHSYSQWDLSNTQKTVISDAKVISENDGHPPTLVPAIILQESGAGTKVDNPTYMGVGQMSVVATTEVIKTYPEIGEFCQINSRMPKSSLKQMINRNNKCGAKLTSKYLVILKSRYKMVSLERLIMAYNVGPIAAKRIGTNNYTRSVINNMHNLKV